MRSYVEILIILPLLIMSYQLYAFSIKSEIRRRQDRCLKLGVFFMTAGITALAFKSAPSAIFGLVMIMFGFRLIAKGLDRLDKNIFIDKYKDDDNCS